jgi:hypothetical protein
MANSLGVGPIGKMSPTRRLQEGTLAVDDVGTKVPQMADGPVAHPS